MATLVLVHGGWGGSWCWKDVARILRASGHDVYAPTSSGTAERACIPADLVDLSTHVSEVAGLIAFEQLEDVVLVGHSYGGMVITGAADKVPDHIAGMIYFDAFVPEQDQSLWDLVSPETRDFHSGSATRHDGGGTVPAPPSPRTPSGPDVRSYAPYTPQPIKTLQEKWRSVRDRPTWPPRHYVLCTAFSGSPFHKIAARIRREPNWTISEIDAFHDVIYAQPERVATALIQGLDSMGLK